jgi:hypothetical protein
MYDAVSVGVAIIIFASLLWGDRLLDRLEKTFRLRFDRPKLGTTHHVEIRCPETDTTIGTEHTDTAIVDDDPEGGTIIAAYECDECGTHHAYLWGPPTPIHVGDCTTEELIFGVDWAK